MIKDGIDSVSPYSSISHKTHKTGILPDTGHYYGLTVKREFEGWFFVWSRELWNEIKLDERITFWCSDDATVQWVKIGRRHHRRALGYGPLHNRCLNLVSNDAGPGRITLDRDYRLHARTVEKRLRLAQ